MHRIENAGRTRAGTAPIGANPERSSSEASRSVALPARPCRNSLLARWAVPARRGVLDGDGSRLIAPGLPIERAWAIGQARSDKQVAPTRCPIALDSLPNCPFGAA